MNDSQRRADGQHVRQLFLQQRTSARVDRPPIVDGRGELRPVLAGDSSRFDVVCLSHLRWSFVYQRPQHLLSRCAETQRVFFVEEPIFDDGPARLEIEQQPSGVYVVVPHLPEAEIENNVALRAALLDQLLAQFAIERYVLWYYTPLALSFTRHLTPLATVYDCMDELSAFTGASPQLREREAELFMRADLVFTGGPSLYEAKRSLHPSVYALPSSVDVAHFARARQPQPDPADQAGLVHPRIGFYGVIDERMDLQLLDGLAMARPDWQIVMIGPVTKIDPETLPQRPNIHYLGGKRYDELPEYLAGWDVALLPFARNEATRFISPTKTPEYLAAGKPVVSTSIRDVMRPYGERGLVRIADSVAEFVAAVEAALAEDAPARIAAADAMLQQMSWNRTWAQMYGLIRHIIERRAAPADRASAG